MNNEAKNRRNTEHLLDIFSGYSRSYYNGTPAVRETLLPILIDLADTIFEARAVAVRIPDACYNFCTPTPYGQGTGPNSHLPRAAR